MAVEHEGTQHRHAATDDGDVGAEVGVEVHLEPGDVAVLVGRQGERLDLVAAVVGRHQALAAGLGVLHRLGQPTRHRPGDPLLGSGLQLAAETTTDVGGDDPDLGLGYAGGGRQGEAEDVRDLGRRPHGELLTGRVDHDAARLHERRDEPLLSVLTLDEDAVGACRLDGGLHVAAGACLPGVEDPQGGLVAAEVGMGEDLVLQGVLDADDGRQLVVVDVDQLGGVAGLGRAAGDDDGHDLAGEGDPVGRHRRVGGGLLVGRDGPRVDADAELVTEVLAGQHGDDVGRGLGRLDVHRGDGRVGERAAHHGQVQHPREGDVVGPAGATRDQALVLLAAAVLADLGCGTVLGGSHACAPSAAWSTLLTML